MLEQSCSRVQILATSREGVGIDGERILAVPSLGSPRPDTSLATIVEADAVRLFLDRARGFGAELEVTADNAEWVGQVCRRLDGVPLAIELAAARLPTMNPRDLAARLDRRFRVLAGGRRGKIQRHQTLRAVIDWSYDLLSEPEQRLLARVTVFSGGWTLDAAEDVCSGGPVDADEVFEVTERLVARSLVVAEDRGFQTRYRLLETIREYGEERPAEHGETDEYRSRHAEFYCEFAERVSAEILGPQQIDAGLRFGAEHENLSAAINNAIDADDADLGLRLVCGVPLVLAQIGFEFQPRQIRQPGSPVPPTIPCTPDASDSRPSTPRGAATAHEPRGFVRNRSPRPSASVSMICSLRSSRWSHSRFSRTRGVRPVTLLRTRRRQWRLLGPRAD